MSDSTRGRAKERWENLRASGPKPEERMNRPTYTLKPDLPDATNGHWDIAAMQEEYLTERIGWALYGALCERIREEESNVRTQLRTRQR